MCGPGFQGPGWSLRQTPGRRRVRGSSSGMAAGGPAPGTHSSCHPTSAGHPSPLSGIVPVDSGLQTLASLLSTPASSHT